MRVRDRVVRIATVGLLLIAAFLFGNATNAIAAGPDFLDELGSQLKPLRGGSDTAIAAARQSDATISRAERVLVQVYVSGPADDAVARLQEAGVSVKATADEPLPVVEGWVPATALADLARLAFVSAVLPVMGGGSDAGSVQSQGVAAHRIPQSLTAGASSGAGVDVGVISTSINRVGGGVADSQATGDLPPGGRVSILKDGLSPNDDEGRAMAEIIYDGAPGLDKLLFASGTSAGPAGKADSINQLVAAGADVIADDIFQLGEPFFQDGVVAQAVDAARAAGVIYLASAGNRARQSYEGTYSDALGFHDFNPGFPEDSNQAVVMVPNGKFLQIALNWDEPWGLAETNLNALLRQANGLALPSASVSGGLDNNLTTGLPREIVTWSNTSGSTVNVGLRIQRIAGTASPFLKYIARGNFGKFDIVEYATNSDTINPDAASANGAITVAAVSASDPGRDSPQPYSSRGPKTRLLDANGVRLGAPEVRIKPEIAAADVVSTTVPGFLSFPGTSASVPGAASIATVLRSSNPEASAAEIEARMSDPASAIDCVSSVLVPDPDCGAGFLLADAAFVALDQTGPIVSASLRPAGPNGRGGWFTRDVGISWNATDAESAIESAPCAATGDSTDGVEIFTCEATSGGGSTTGSITVKRDAVRPATPKISGIRPGTFGRSGKRALPPKGRIRCRSKDDTSGLASCRITGYSRKAGRHTLVAKASDRAGLSATSKLRYTVRAR